MAASLSESSVISDSESRLRSSREKSFSEVWSYFMKQFWMISQDTAISYQWALAGNTEPSLKKVRSRVKLKHFSCWVGSTHCRGSVIPHHNSKAFPILCFCLWATFATMFNYTEIIKVFLKMQIKIRGFVCFPYLRLCPWSNLKHSSTHSWTGTKRSQEPAARGQRWTSRSRRILL